MTKNSKFTVEIVDRAVDENNQILRIQADHALMHDTLSLAAFGQRSKADRFGLAIVPGEQNLLQISRIEGPGLIKSPTSSRKMPAFEFYPAHPPHGDYRIDRKWHVWRSFGMPHFIHEWDGAFEIVLASSTVVLLRVVGPTMAIKSWPPQPVDLFNKGAA